MSRLRHAFFLAGAALRAAPFRSGVLVLGAAVALFLPMFTLLGTRAVEEEMLRRATESPILVGREGNEFDLTLGALYFSAEVRDPVTVSELDDLESKRYGLSVPLYLRHSAAGIRIVGTGLSYFDARSLRIAQGRRMALLGEVVAGAEAARRHGLEVGNALRSDLTNLYNLAGAYPKMLRVVGILEPTGGPDDDVLFADIKTAWFLDGRIHGHEEVTRADALNPDAAEDETLEATADGIMDAAGVVERSAASQATSEPMTESEVFESWLVEHCGVQLNDGEGYGKGGERCMRMNIGTSREIIRVALDNMAQAIRSV